MVGDSAGASWSIAPHLVCSRKKRLRVAGGGLLPRRGPADDALAQAMGLGTQLPVGGNMERPVNDQIVHAAPSGSAREWRGTASNAGATAELGEPVHARPGGRSHRLMDLDGAVRRSAVGGRARQFVRHAARRLRGGSPAALAELAANDDADAGVAQFYRLRVAL